MDNINPQNDLARDKRIILNAYRRLLKEVNKTIKPQNPVGVKLIKKAFKLADAAHFNMRRRNGEPYITHPIEVAIICVREIGLGIRSTIAALLHDTVEDTSITLKDIEKIFGKEIAEIVDSLTKITTYNARSTSKQVENFKYILMSIAHDPRVVLIKLADRLHNMRTLQHLPRVKQLKIASETSFIYAPLAHRLGLFAIKIEMEDLVLKHLEPEVYREIAGKLAEKKEERKRYINDFIRPIKSTLEKRNITCEIYGRPKSISSIRNKITKKQVSFEEVYDLFAIRVIIDSKPQEEHYLCWSTYSVITALYPPLPYRLRDWISKPKNNGYEALHITVLGNKGRRVEVQIRTNRMHDIAEKGLAAHYKYKEDKVHKGISKFDELFTNIREYLVDEKEKKQSSYDFLEDFKTNFLSEEVHIFTPKGDIKILPKGSTAIDFAFAIHSKIGETAIGARVNGRLMPLHQVLKNGDQIQIKTSAKQIPQESWLDIAFTSKTKSKVKDAIRKYKTRILEDGKKILDKYFEKRGIHKAEKNYLFVKNYFHLENVAEVYILLNSKKITPPSLDDFKVIHGILTNAKTFTSKISEFVGVKSKPKNQYKASKTPLKINTLPITLESHNDNVIVSLAECCRPVFGDTIIGFKVSDQNAKIHRQECKTAKYLLAVMANKTIKATWEDKHLNTSPSYIIFESLDRIGIVNIISNKISNNYKKNITELHFTTSNGHCKGEIKIQIKDRDQLDKLIKDLSLIDGVKRVYRKSLI